MSLILIKMKLIIITVILTFISFEGFSKNNGTLKTLKAEIISDTLASKISNASYININNIWLRPYQNANVSVEKKYIKIINPNKLGGAGLRFVLTLNHLKRYFLKIGGRSNNRILPSLRLQINKKPFIYSTLPKLGEKLISINNSSRLEVLVYSDYNFEYLLNLIDLQELGPSNTILGPDINILETTKKNILHNITASQIYTDININEKTPFNEKVAKIRYFIYKNTNTGIATPIDNVLTYKQLKNSQFFGLCNNTSNIYRYLLKIVGIESRTVKLYSKQAIWLYLATENTISSDQHTTVEVWDINLKKWILSDPSFNSFFKIEQSEEFASTKELSNALSTNKTFTPVYFGNVIKDNRKVETYYLPYKKLLYKIAYHN
tara:strand:- start:821 stop:1954 length:1134 start_codon:yes stop_codon:yes gene_type:complete